HYHSLRLIGRIHRPMHTFFSNARRPTEGTRSFGSPPWMPRLEAVEITGFGIHQQYHCCRKLTLYFDIIPGSWSPRHISKIGEAIEAPEQVEWEVALKGVAMVKAATLVVESVYAISVERGEDA